MSHSYINKIKANIAIYANKKTTNILDGSYKSIFKGKSFNFEDLREYVIGDNIKDIDWKASSRSKNLLVKQYIALKKHNIMFVMDTDKRMLGASESGLEKKELALYTTGTIGYLALKNGDVVASIYKKNDKVEFTDFKENMNHLELLLAQYEHDVTMDNNCNLNDTLDFIRKNIRRRMILFIITDLKGLDSINEKLLKELSINHSILFLIMKDSTLVGTDAYSIDSDTDIPEYLLNDPKLLAMEKELKRKVARSNVKKLKKYKITIAGIGSMKEIPIKVIRLLEEHKYANIH